MTFFGRRVPFAPRALPRFVARTDPSVRLSPSPRYAFWLVCLPCFSGFSPQGEEPFPVFFHDLGHVLSLSSSTPLNGASVDRIRSHLLPSPILSQLGARFLLITGPPPDIHSLLRPAPSLTPPAGLWLMPASTGSKDWQTPLRFRVTMPGHDQARASRSITVTLELPLLIVLGPHVALLAGPTFDLGAGGSQHQSGSSIVATG
jgi:hypothetical protein